MQTPSGQEMTTLEYIVSRYANKNRVGTQEFNKGKPLAIAFAAAAEQKLTEDQLASAKS